jgi:hypothetical protein
MDVMTSLEIPARTNRLFDTAEGIWLCPSCRRSKQDIGIKSEDGSILFAIVRHHDHLRDYPRDYFRKRLGEDWAGLLQARLPGAVEFIDRIKAFTISFSHIRVCQPCNHLEQEAKIVTRAPKYFSFPPQAMFVALGRSGKPMLNHRTLGVTYSRLLPEYEMRFKVAQRFLHYLERGTFWVNYSIPCN